MLWDGDSCTHNAVNKAKVYGSVVVQKDVCANHVQKRMGTALHYLLQKHKGDSGERISGKGRLTRDLITKPTYSMWALKSHSRNVHVMHAAVWATYYHVTSTDWKVHNAAMDAISQNPVKSMEHTKSEAGGHDSAAMYDGTWQKRGHNSHNGTPLWRLVQ